MAPCFYLCDDLNKGMAGRTQQRDESGFASVFLMGLFLNSLWKFSLPFGSAYSGVHAAICLKLPSMAILPWVVDRLLRKSPIKNNEANPLSSRCCCFVTGYTLKKSVYFQKLSNIFLKQPAIPFPYIELSHM